MALWAIVPALVMGWEPTVVSSGSMSPSLRVGDVVLIDRDSPVNEGDIVAFQAGDHTVVHRAVGTTEEGEVTTRGDANRVDDSGSLGQEEIVGRARMVVPFIGMPTLWGNATLLVALVGLLLSVAVLRERPAIGVGVLVVGTALAAFTATSVAWVGPTSSSGSSFEAAIATAPTGFVANCGNSVPGSITVNLAWNAAANATEYRVWHDPPGGGNNYFELATVPSTQTNYTHIITSGNGRHRFRATTLVGTWESDTSNIDRVRVRLNQDRCRG